VSADALGVGQKPADTSENVYPRMAARAADHVVQPGTVFSKLFIGAQWLVYENRMASVEPGIGKCGVRRSKAVDQYPGIKYHFSCD